MLHDASVLKKSGAKYVIGELVGQSKPAEHKPKDETAFTYWPTPVFEPGPVASKTSGGTSHLLPAERARATFDVDKMTNVLYAGQMEKRRFILHPTKAISMGYKKYDETRDEAISRHVSDFVKIHRPFTLEGYRPETSEVSWMAEAATNSGSMMPHYGLFVPTLVSFCLFF